MLSLFRSRLRKLPTKCIENKLWTVRKYLLIAFEFSSTQTQQKKKIIWSPPWFFSFWIISGCDLQTTVCFASGWTQLPIRKSHCGWVIDIPQEMKYIRINTGTCSVLPVNATPWPLVGFGSAALVLKLMKDTPHVHIPIIIQFFIQLNLVLVPMFP